MDRGVANLWPNKNLAVRCRRFNNASNQFLTIASNLGASAYPQTMACWFNKDPSSGNSCLIANCTSGTDDNSFRIVATASAGSPTTLQGVVRTTTAQTANSAINWTANVPQHACFSCTSATNRWIYLNGGNGGQNVTNRTPSGMNTTNVGKFSVTTTYMLGTIWDVAIWPNDALSADEADLLWQGARPWEIRPGRCVYFPLDGVNSEMDMDGLYAMTPSGGPTIDYTIPSGFRPQSRYSRNRFGKLLLNTVAPITSDIIMAAVNQQNLPRRPSIVATPYH